MTHREQLRSIAKIRKGYTPEALSALAHSLGASDADWPAILGVSRRTIQRAFQRHDNLDVHVSDRIARIQRVYDLASSILGDTQKARLWLTRPNRVLEGQVPLRLLDTDAGTQLVEDELRRIEFGFPA
jgi:putative toxin-antitoxin system antitoxin component (TIGR02293 family)